MVLDYNIILYEYRQCLSVVAFLLMILLLGKKNYLWALVCAIIAITCHKAGAMVVIPTILFYFFSQNIVPRSIFAILLVALALMLLLPVTNISIDFLSLLPFSRTALHSIEHHLMIGKQIQSIFIVYAVVLLFLVHYAQYSRSRMEIIAASALIGILFIVILYQYYYLLNRIRSYFTPVIIVYIFQYAQNTDKQSVRVPYSMLIKQFISVIIFIFMLHTNASLYRNEKQMHNHVNEKCTVFDLMGSASVKDVQRKQMRRAEKYWDEDFMKSDENHIQR